MSVPASHTNKREYGREIAYLVIQQGSNGRYHGLVGGEHAIENMYGAIPGNACQIGEITLLSRTPGDTLRVIPHEELVKLFAGIQVPVLADFRTRVAEPLDDLPF